ncbi:winged helix-turn-helix transcriptional regulator [Nocardia sp. NPDC005746]|uniref:winged helix-turn-helix transcriptional regulator n=1 Tax=unclassified Nocardia TaxID=2637762 RepID=UPI0034051299
MHAEAPPRVEHSLTALGRTLQEPIAMLTEWAQVHGAALVDFQESTAAKQTHQVPDGSRTTQTAPCRLGRLA